MSEIILFEQSGQPVQVRLQGDTVWLTQLQMAKLFGTSTDNVSQHLKNIFEDKELEETATTEDFSVVRQEGSRQVQRRIKHYNLDTIISIGYRVNSTRATRFRQWATQRLREILNWNVPPATSRLSAKATMWCMVSQKTIKRCMIR